MSEPERLYTLEEVARHLGLNVRTIKRFVAAGKLQVRRFGRTARVSGDEFARFLREGTEPPRPSRREVAMREEQSSIDRKLIFESLKSISAPRGPRKKGGDPK